MAAALLAACWALSLHGLLRFAVRWWRTLMVVALLAACLALSLAAFVACCCAVVAALPITCLVESDRAFAGALLQAPIMVPPARTAGAREPLTGTGQAVQPGGLGLPALHGAGPGRVAAVRFPRRPGSPRHLFAP